MPSPKIIFDNVHGNIKLTDLEREIIDTNIFQRLRRVSHLALAEYVFPGATHSRFAHSLGTMYTITEMFDSLVENVKGRIKIPAEDRQVISLVGLLHDIGHLPFSHVFEGLMSDETGLKHEDLTLKLIKESRIGEILQQPKYKDVNDELLYNILEKKFVPDEKHQLNYVSLIDGNLDADKLDYLKRDSINTGVGYGAIEVDRILKTISVDDKGLLCILNKGRLALENLCIARYHMFQTVYMHKTVVAFEGMLSKAYELMMKDKDFEIYTFKEVIKMSPSDYVKYADYYVWDKINNYEGENIVLKELCEMLINHKPVKLVIEDPVLLMPNEERNRKLSMLKFDDQQKLISEKMGDFDSDWLFITDSRTKFRKSDHENDPIQVEFSVDGGGQNYIDVSDIPYSIMIQLQKEYTNMQVFTHEKYCDKLKKVLKEAGFGSQE